MVLKLYNTLTRTKDEFHPLDAKNVRMYVCGPTVYDFAHIGNARPVIVFDVLFRLLRHLYGADHVTYVRNITDVDDKINARATEEGVSIRDVTERTAKQYFEDVAALGAIPPTHQPRATEFVPQMIAMIERLIAAGFAYPAEGHVLFDVGSKPDYGKLSRRSLDEMIAGARVEVAPYKRNAMDFVLWKPSSPEQPGWDSPWGRGRPGWHIECSAMSEALLGETFDIHGGGIDLVFPHHENEIAQSEGVHDYHPLARVWMHNGFLQVEGEKMSKSLGNFFTIRELLREYPAGALRLTMLQTHYRQPINWTAAKVKEAWSELRDWSAMIYGSQAHGQMIVRDVRKHAPKPHSSVADALEDDLNTPEAITALRALFKNRDDPETYCSLIETSEFLGLFHITTIGAYSRGVVSKNLGADRTFPLHDKIEALKVALINQDSDQLRTITDQIADVGISVDIHPGGSPTLKPQAEDKADTGGEIERLIEARNEARKTKNFKESDRIRDELAAKGIVLKDGPSGTTWEVKR